MADFADQVVRTVGGPVSLADYVRGLGASDFIPVNFVHGMSWEFALPLSCLRVEPALTSDEARIENERKRICVRREGNRWIICFLRAVPFKVQADLDYIK